MFEKIKNKTVSTLRWSEQYTKTDMVYLAKEGSWLGAGRVFAATAGSLLAIAFANLIPQETYGTYKFVLSAAGIIGAFTLSGMGPAVSQAVSRGYEGALRSGFKETLKWSIGIVVIALGAAGYYYIQGNTTLSIAMLFIGGAYPILKSAELYQYFLEGKKEFKTKSLYLVGWEIFEVCALVLTLLLTENILVILSVFFATNAMAAFFLYQKTLKKYQPQTEEDPETTSYGKHLSLIKVLSTIANHIDKVLVFHFLGAVELAIYAFATLPIQKLGKMNGVIGSLALPKFSATKISTLKQTLTRKVLIFLGLSLIGVMIFVLTAPYLYDLLLPQYTNSVKYAQFFAISILFFPSTLFAQALTAHSQKRALYIFNIGANILKIILLLTLLPIYGIWGAIYTLTIDAAVKFFSSGYFFYSAEKDS